MSSAAETLIARQYNGGTTVTNCVVHMGRSLLDRPEDCRLCRADVRNHLSQAIAVNKWLNEWKADATELLRGTPTPEASPKSPPVSLSVQEGQGET